MAAAWPRRPEAPHARGHSGVAWAAGTHTPAMRTRARTLRAHTRAAHLGRSLKASTRGARPEAALGAPGATQSSERAGTRQDAGDFVSGTSGGPAILGALTRVGNMGPTNGVTSPGRNLGEVNRRWPKFDQSWQGLVRIDPSLAHVRPDSNESVQFRPNLVRGRPKLCSAIRSGFCQAEGCEASSGLPRHIPSAAPHCGLLRRWGSLPSSEKCVLCNPQRLQICAHQPGTRARPWQTVSMGEVGRHGIWT